MVWRVLWNVDDPSDIRLSLEGIGVDLTIPDVLAFKGRCGSSPIRQIQTRRSINTASRGGEADSVLYHLAVDAEILVVNTSQGFTAFYIYINSDFPAGIALASTGVALYGVAGLVGQNGGSQQA